MIYIALQDFYVPDCPADLEVTATEIIGVTEHKAVAEGMIKGRKDQLVQEGVEDGLAPIEIEDQYEFSIAEKELVG